jgi:hypothetical protein
MNSLVRLGSKKCDEDKVGKRTKLSGLTNKVTNDAFRVIESVGARTV